jgi:hypothetical protein
VARSGPWERWRHRSPRLRLIGEIDVPNLTVVGGTLVGGLSGIDYDPSTGAWVFISDDRSDLDSARLYDASLTYDDTEFTEALLLAAHPLLQESGIAHPNELQGGPVPDPEAIRVDPTMVHCGGRARATRSSDPTRC